jgi:long-chain acyl-CoA synthetase
MNSKKNLFDSLSSVTGNNELFKKVFTKLGNDEPLAMKARKAWFYALGRLEAPLYLSACTKVGKGARVRGRPYIENYGTITVGENFNIRSLFVVAHMVTGPGGVIEIGDDVKVQVGVGICAYSKITIGSRVSIGPHVMILDSDFHSASDYNTAPEAAPIEIGNDVWLAYRVTVLRGSKIGDGSVITAGSVVAGEIPPGVIAGGNPARVLRRIEGKDPFVETAKASAEVEAAPRAPMGSVAIGAATARQDRRPLTAINPELVQRVRQVAAEAFQLTQLPELEAGPGQILAWDSLGQLRLSIAVEEKLGVTLSADDMQFIANVGHIVQVVDSATSTASTTSTTSGAAAALATPTPAADTGQGRTFQLPMVAHQALLDREKTLGDKAAVICDGKTTTYGQLVARAGGLAKGLRAANVKKGDAVLFLIDDKLEYLATLYAIWMAGGVAVPVVDGAAVDTVEELASACSAALFITTDAEQKRFGATKLSVATKGLSTLGASADGPAAPTVTVLPGDPAQIMFTSGTSAKKKAVVLSHRNVMQSTVNINEFTSLDSHVVEYVTVPITHSFGLGRARSVLSAGGTLVLHSGFLSPPKVIKAIKDHRCNAISWVPAGFAMFADYEQGLREIGDQVTVMELGSAAMPRPQKEKLMSLFPRARICMHYGLTEASRSAFLEFHSEKAKLDTVGRPSPNVAITIRSEDGAELALGQEGEIVVSGDHVTSGYLGNDALNARTRFGANHFRTGDYGFFDEEGYLHLLGRKDDMINAGGIKISPLEVEEKIREVFPQLDFCVLGIASDNQLLGEIPVMAYVKQDGVDISMEALAGALHDHLDRNKFPRAVLAVDALPKTENGKVQRHKLRELVGAQKDALQASLRV